VEGTTYTISATDDILDVTETISYTPLGCTLDVNANISNGTIVASATDSDLSTCKNLSFEFNFGAIYDHGDYVEVYYASNLKGNTASPTSFTHYIEYDGERYDLGHLESLFGVNLLKTTQATLDDCLNVSMAGEVYQDKFVELTFSVNGFNPASSSNVLDSTVEIVYNGINYSTVVSNGTVYRSSVAIPFKTGNLSLNEKVVFDVEASFTIEDGVEGKIYDGTFKGNDTYKFFSAGSGQSKTYHLPNFCTDEDYSGLMPIVIGVEGLTLENGCSYKDFSRSFNLSPTTSIVYPGSLVEIVVEPLTSAEALTKFVWYKGSSKIYEEYGTNQSILPVSFIELGSEYTVIGDNPPCSDSDTISYCPYPALTYTVDGCNDCINVTLTGEPGLYQVDLATGQSEVIEIISGNATGTIEGPFAANASILTTVTIIGSTCSFTQTIVTDSGVSPSYQFPACSAGFYDILISNATPDWETNILLGSGTVAGNGYDILNIDELDPPIFQITDTSTNCQTSTIDGTRPTPCSVSSSQPASSSNITASSSVNVSSGAVSSSGNASSSHPLPSSSRTSSLGASSQPQSSSEFESSSNIVSSSAINSSSRAMSSSMAPPSAIGGDPCSCGSLSTTFLLSCAGASAGHKKVNVNSATYCGVPCTPLNYPAGTQVPCGETLNLQYSCGACGGQSAMIIVGTDCTSCQDPSSIASSSVMVSSSLASSGAASSSSSAVSSSSKALSSSNLPVVAPSSGATTSVCDNINMAFNGGNEYVDQTFVSNGSGTVNWQFNSFQEPDALTITKNGILIISTGCISNSGATCCGVEYLANGPRTGSFSVEEGDSIRVIVDGGCTTCSACDNLSVWIFAATCS